MRISFSEKEPMSLESFAWLCASVSERGSEEAFAEHPEAVIGNFCQPGGDEGGLRRLGGIDLFARMAAIMLPKWVEGDTFADARRAALSDMAAFAEMVGLARREVKSVPEVADNVWDMVDWAFPNAVIAEALGVTRQAAHAQRAKAGERTAEKAMEASVRNVMDMLGLSRQTAVALCTIRHADAEKAAVSLPDAENGPGFWDGDLPAPEWLAKRKGVSGKIAAMLLLATMPASGNGHDAAIERALRIPPGSVTAMRFGCEGWRERLALIPDRGKGSFSKDAVQAVCEAKGLEEEEAAALLWSAFGRGVRRKAWEAAKDGTVAGDLAAESGFLMEELGLKGADASIRMADCLVTKESFVELWAYPWSVVNLAFSPHAEKREGFTELAREFDYEQPRWESERKPMSPDTVADGYVEHLALDLVDKGEMDLQADRLAGLGLLARD